MIIWHGWGILAALIPYFSILFTEIIVEKIFQDKFYYQNNSWPMYLGLIIGIVLVYLLSLYLSKEKGRVVVDKQTGKELILKNKHTLFFIDIKYWPYILLLLTIYLFVKDFFKL